MASTQRTESRPQMTTTADRSVVFNMTDDTDCFGRRSTLVKREIDSESFSVRTEQSDNYERKKSTFSNRSKKPPKKKQKKNVHARLFFQGA